MYSMAVDIGYSNLKVAFGDGSKCQTLTLPATAGPADRMPPASEGKRQGLDPISVLIDGEQWVACVEPGRLQSVNRETHANYAQSQPYRALLNAALSQAEKDTIDLLITGLPVHQAKDPKVRQTVAKTFSGTHQIAGKRSVTVKRVNVVPQPQGAYMDLVTNAGAEALDVIENGRVVVLDPGFFSVDYIAVERGELRPRVSGTSLKAMSTLLTETDMAIKGDYANGPGTDRLEHAMQNGQQSVLVSGKRIDIGPYLEKAAAYTTQQALVQMAADMREESDNVDLVLIAGGGAHQYKQAAEKTFPNCSHIVIPDEPHLANVRGYYQLGCNLAEAAA